MVTQKDVNKVLDTRDKTLDLEKKLTEVKE